MEKIHLESEFYFVHPQVQFDIIFNIYHYCLINSFLNLGVAAYNISGYTLHQAFGLPFSQFDGIMPRLTEINRNRLACEFQDLNLIIIDEISMTSREQLFQIDDRLRQIFKTSANFGGKYEIKVYGTKYSKIWKAKLSSFIGQSLQ